MAESLSKLIYVGKVKPKAGWHNKYSTHPHHELIVVLSGVMHVSGCGQQFELHSGDAALYPAGVEHREHADNADPVESCFIVFDDSALSGNSIAVNRDQGLFLRPMAAALHEHSMSGEPAAFQDEYLNLMLKIFSTGLSDAGEKSGELRNIHAFMRKNMARDITLDELAEAAGLSKYHFLRRYHRECGKTPFQDLWEIRCSEAVSLLKYTALPMKEIALRTGFYDAAHFSRRIKAFCGKAPGSFRNG